LKYEGSEDEEVVPLGCKLRVFNDYITEGWKEGRRESKEPSMVFHIVDEIVRCDECGRNPAKHDYLVQHREVHEGTRLGSDDCVSKKSEDDKAVPLGWKSRAVDDSVPEGWKPGEGQEFGS
jgi:hypothetical protein